MTETCCLAPQLAAVGAVADDHEVGRVVPAEQLDQRLHALELLQPRDDEEVRAAGSGLALRPAAAWLGDEVGRWRIGRSKPRRRASLS